MRRRMFAPKIHPATATVTDVTNGARARTGGRVAVAVGGALAVAHHCDDGRGGGQADDPSGSGRRTVRLRSAGTEHHGDAAMIQRARWFDAVVAGERSGVRGIGSCADARDHRGQIDGALRRCVARDLLRHHRHRARRHRRRRCGRRNTRGSPRPAADDRSGAGPRWSAHLGIVADPACAGSRRREWRRGDRVPDLRGVPRPGDGAECGVADGDEAAPRGPGRDGNGRRRVVRRRDGRGDRGHLRDGVRPGGGPAVAPGGPADRCSAGHRGDRRVVAARAARAARSKCRDGRVPGRGRSGSGTAGPALRAGDRLLLRQRHPGRGTPVRAEPDPRSHSSRTCRSGRPDVPRHPLRADLRRRRSDRPRGTSRRAPPGWRWFHVPRVPRSGAPRIGPTRARDRSRTGRDRHRGPRAPTRRRSPRAPGRRAARVRGARHRCPRPDPR